MTIVVDLIIRSLYGTQLFVHKVITKRVFVTVIRADQLYSKMIIAPWSVLQVLVIQMVVTLEYRKDFLELHRILSGFKKLQELQPIIEMHVDLHEQIKIFENFNF